MLIVPDRICPAHAPVVLFTLCGENPTPGIGDMYRALAPPSESTHVRLHIINEIKLKESGFQGKKYIILKVNFNLKSILTKTRTWQPDVLCAPLL